MNEKKHTDSIKTIVEEAYASHSNKNQFEEEQKDLTEDLRSSSFGPHKHCSVRTNQEKNAGTSRKSRISKAAQF